MSEGETAAATTEREPTEEEKQTLELYRTEYEECKNVGCADEPELFRRYHDYAVDLLIDLSGKLDIPDKDQEADEGYVKPGGWGGNANPATWVTTVMKDHPEWWKVVDDTRTNIATGFKTQESAQRYIDEAKKAEQCPLGQHFDAATGKCVVDQPGPTGQYDQFGLLKIYGDKLPLSVNTKWIGVEKRRNYASGKKSEDSYEYTATAKSKEQNSNIEVTLYTKINSFKTNEADSLSDKLTGPAHSDGNCCWVIPDFMSDGSAKKTLETEKPHPKNHGVNPKPVTNIGGSIVGKWFGHKAITYVRANGRRYVESWIHFPVSDIDNISKEQDKWRQYVPTTELSNDYVKANGLLMTCRIDGVKKGDPPNFKYASVREIEPPIGL